MKIRLFREEDSEEMYTLLHEFLDFTRKSYSKKVLKFDDFVDSTRTAYVKKILKEFRNLKKSRFLVAQEESRVIGYIVGCVENNSNKIRKRAGHIKSFYVTNTQRGSGTGTELYNTLVEWFTKQKCDHHYLDVFDGNQKTLCLYKKWGLTENTLKMKKNL